MPLGASEVGRPRRALVHRQGHEPEHPRPTRPHAGDRTVLRRPGKVRRQLPKHARHDSAVRQFDNSRYVFGTSAGPKTLLDLFAGQRQLVVYQFMDNGPDDYCPGCTHFTSNVVDLAALTDAGVSWATVSNMPLAQIEAYKARMGWTMPFVSSHGTTFADDCGAGGGFMLSVFLRDGEDVYRTYCTTARGVDRLMFVGNILDLTPYGRQEDWEDSPPGRSIPRMVRSGGMW